MRWWQILFLSFAFGLTLEILQFSFNTGTVYVDDILLYIAGGMIGFFLKRLLDYIRSFITIGQDKTMLSLDYTPIGALKDTDASEDEEEEDDEDFSDDIQEPNQPLPLGDDTDDLMDDTIETPASLPDNTETAPLVTK